MKTKEFLITIFFILILLVTFGFFPATNLFQKLTILIFLLVVLPLLYNRFFLKKKLGDLGIRIGDYKKGLIYSGLGATVVFFILLLIIKYTEILKYYIIPKAITNDFENFIFYEVASTLFIVVVYEFFFRGFVMFNLVNKINYYLATVLQAALFLIFVWATGGSLWLFLLYLVFSPIAGIIAFKSKSIVYSGITQFLIIVFFDANIIRIINK